MKRIEPKRLLTVWRYPTLLVAVGLLWAATGAAAPVEVAPGTTASIPISETKPNCSTREEVSDSNVQDFWSPKTLCDADPSSTPALKVFAASALSTLPPVTASAPVSSLQNLSSTARLSRKFRVPVRTQGPFLSTLRVQVATEVTWSGGFIAAGVSSTFAQVVATLQIRDITDATADDPGPVVASNTFLLERFDSKLDLPDDVGLCGDDEEDYDDDGKGNDVDNCPFTANADQADTDQDGTGDACEDGEEGEDDFCIPLAGLVELLNLVDAVDVSNTSGADVTAYLERGRIYAIELEAKCDVSAPALGFGVCLFSSNVLSEYGFSSNNPLSTVFANDGFQVAPFEVTVDSDPVEELSTTGAYRKCDDGVSCTVDLFDGLGQCASTPNDGLCDDGIACTTSACDAFAGCLYTTDDSVCDDSIACTTDACDLDAGCLNTPVDSDCSNDDGVACTVPTCDGTTGCIEVPDDSSCADAVACTVDSCDPVAGCTNTPDASLCDNSWSVCDPAAGCQSPPGPIVFMTDQGFNGSLGGLDGADAKCTAAANAAGLPGTSYKAFLSTTTVHAKDRVNPNGPYYNTRGVKIADTLAQMNQGWDFSTPVLFDIIYTEAANLIGERKVWTASFTGVYDTFFGRGDCSGWTNGVSSALLAGTGDTSPFTSKSPRWQRFAQCRCNGDCSSYQDPSYPSIYCFQEPDAP